MPLLKPIRKPPPNLFRLLLAAVAASFLHLAIGSVWIPLTDVASGLFGYGERADIIQVLRAPRLLQALVSGGILGVVGCAFQSVFRNPLADPYIVGVSSGASFAGSLAMVLGLGAVLPEPWKGLTVPFFATLGGIAALAMVLSLASYRQRISSHTLLLSGVMVGSLLSALMSLTLLWGGIDSNQILRWLLGSMTPAYWPKVGFQAVALMVGLIYLLSLTRHMNLMAAGTETASRLGIDVPKVQVRILTAGAIMVAISVGVVGIVGFLGLVGPHISRRLLGVDWRWSVLGSMLSGATVLVLADIFAQRLIPSAEVPVGILTALLGAPWLMALLRRESRTSHN